MDWFQLDLKSADPMQWIDTHAHLQAKPYHDDREMVLATAAAAGVKRVLLPGTDLADSRRAVELARQLSHHGVIASIGVHPHDASTYSATVETAFKEMRAQAPAGQIVAIGEIGLDYHYDFSPRDVQRTVFAAQLELALDLDLPVIIHDREATADCLAVIESVYSRRSPRAIPGVFHCFSGSVETARILLKMGFYLGFDGPITFKNARKPLDVIASCPHDRLVLETDSPYLTPEPHRGHRNTPAYIPLIGAAVAQAWGLTLNEVAEQTTRNAERLFDLH